MSIALMTTVWRRAPYDSGTLLVLLALADWADDDGESLFPTVPKVAAKARLSERQTQRALCRLREDRVLVTTADANGVPGVGNQYRLDVEVLTSWPSFEKNGCQKVTRRHVTPDAHVTRTPDTHVTPRVTFATSHIDIPSEESVIKNPPKDDDFRLTGSGEEGKPLVLPSWLPMAEWKSFLEMRKRKRASPTEDAKALLVKKLADLRAAGHDPATILNNSTMNNWTGLFEPRPDARPGQASGSSADKPFYGLVDLTKI